MIKRAIGQLVDFIRIILVARQWKGLSEGCYVDRSTVALEVALEITYAAVAVKYGLKRLQLKTRGVPRGVL